MRRGVVEGEERGEKRHYHLPVFHEPQRRGAKELKVFQSLTRQRSLSIGIFKSLRFVRIQGDKSWSRGGGRAFETSDMNFSSIDGQWSP